MTKKKPITEAARLMGLRSQEVQRERETPEERQARYAAFSQAGVRARAYEKALVASTVTSLQEQVRILVADVDRLTAQIADMTRQADADGLPRVRTP